MTMYSSCARRLRDEFRENYLSSRSCVESDQQGNAWTRTQPGTLVGRSPPGESRDLKLKDQHQKKEGGAQDSSPERVQSQALGKGTVL